MPGKIEPNLTVKQEGKNKMDDLPFLREEGAVGTTLMYCVPKEFAGNKIIDSTLVRDYIEHVLSSSPDAKRNARVYGSLGSKLFQDFSFEFFKRTMGVFPKDTRDTPQKATDSRNSHVLEIGDIFDFTNKNIWAGKTDLVIVQMKDVLDTQKINNQTLEQAIRNWYNILNTNGLLFIQLVEQTEIKDPRIQEIRDKIKASIGTWINAIKEKHPEIDIQIHDGAMRFHKKAGAPEELPQELKLI